MNLQIVLGTVALGTTAILVGHMNSDAVAARGDDEVTFPDVIVGSLQAVQKFGTNGGITAYSVGTTSCNQGNDFLTWDAGTNQHPTIGQNMYRVVTLDNGCSRVEHIGMSWLKHGFCALQETLCGPCDNPASGGCADSLGWNCSDPYSSGLNGQQTNLGPRSEVNATTGFFPFPFCQDADCNYPPTIGRRLQVLTSDMDPDLWPTAEYFVEGMYVHPDDAAACQGHNNASYRPINVSGTANQGFTISLTSTTRQTRPGIYAWAEVDPNVRIETYDLSECNERFHVAYTVCENPDGTYHYEYAIYNLNCDVGFSKFAVPVGDHANIFQSFAPYHSSSPYTNNEWASNMNDETGLLEFSCETFAENEQANAIRWNTMHSFAFDTPDPPVPGYATIETFKTGEQVELNLLVPNANFVDPYCDGDVNRDGTVDGTDLAICLGFWGLPGDSDANEDGTTDGADLTIVLANWGCTGK